MRSFIYLLWKHISPKNRFYFFVITVLMVIAANLELLGITLFIPMIASLVNPELFAQNKYLKLCMDFFHAPSSHTFLLCLCITIVVIFFMKNAYLFLLTWLQSEYIRKIAVSLTCRLFHIYIKSPYLLFLQRNNAEMKSYLEMTEGNVRGSIQSIFMTIIEIINIIAIFCMLLFFVPGGTLLLIGFSGVFSLLIYFPIRKRSIECGNDLFASRVQLEALRQQAFYGIKDIRIRQAEEHFIQRNAQLLEKQGTINIRLNLLSQMPRFLIEFGMVAGGILLLSVYLISGTCSASIILKLFLIAASVSRLMPSLSRVQYHLSFIRQFQASIFTIFKDMDTLKEEKTDSSSVPVTFQKEIEIQNLSFSYPGSENNVIQNFSLRIPVKTSVAFIGKTGCGKTTLVDLISGLLEPDVGRILSDGRNIRENIVSWRSMIGYVSQFIYIMDDTIEANVTLGCKDKIDRERVKECLKTAQIYDFIETLPDGIETRVGENGSKLSGGQKQRIGIARALYHNPQILILDEATSALDNETEQAFIDALRNLHGKMTILIIAHRLSTTRGCTQIIDLTKQQNN